MKDQFLFVYSLLVIHTQQVFYSHKRPNNKRVNSSTVSGKDNHCTYLYTYYTYYTYCINPIYPTSNPIQSKQIQSNLYTNPIQIHPNTNKHQSNPTSKYQSNLNTNPIQFIKTLWKIYT